LFKIAHFDKYNIHKEGKMPATKTENAYQLKITLKDSKPPIWRRFIVSESITLVKLHHVIQEVMGWYDSHLHEFEFNGECYGQPDPDAMFEINNEKKVKLNLLINTEKDKFLYNYDFGDDWRHVIVLEKILTEQPAPVKPKCITGKMACPPEDCGGLWGYYDMLETLKDPKSPEYEETIEWLGGEFDSEAFDIDWVNQELKRIR
jgi:hypothetical protein